MDYTEYPIESIKFDDITGAGFSWDVIYEECGIAFRDGVTPFFLKDKVWEIKMVVFIICIKGSSQFSENGNIIRLEAGDVLIRVPGTTVADCMVSPDFKCKVLCLNPDVFTSHISEHDFFENALRVIDNPVLKIDVDKNLAALMESYDTILKIKAKDKDSNHNNIIISHIVECLLYEILCNIPKTETTRIRQTHGSKFVLFNRFIEMVTADKGSLRSVKKYADKLNITPQYLSEVCQKLSGKSPVEWINDTLKREIDRLLKYTNYSVREVSDLLNFSDCSLFSKYMKKHYNTTALQHRAKLRQPK
ncbi:MAG: helix-turn-helix transcriptional regulator [Bacteroides sp.]|nr:helix-turn-helix transcriptional regulator [Bacteroides sp.]